MQTRIKERLGRMETNIFVDNWREFQQEKKFYIKNDFKVITKSKDFICLERDIETVKILRLRK